MTTYPNTMPHVAILPARVLPCSNNQRALPKRLRQASVWLLACLLIFGWLAASAEAAWNVWPFNRDSKPGKPDKVVAVWTDTVMTRSGQTPIRGFGGRLLFYENKKEDPIKVEGSLVVYAFDETGRDSNNTKPDFKFVFTPDQLPAHYSKSKVGHSYSVWIPWDEVGGMQKEITLIVRFEPKTGAAVVGEQARHMLPGRTPPPSTVNVASALPTNILPAMNIQAAMNGQQALPNQQLPSAVAANQGMVNGPAASIGADGWVQRVSYESPVVSGNAPLQDDGRQARRMTTATIAMPPDMPTRTPSMLAPMPGAALGPAATAANLRQQAACQQAACRQNTGWQNQPVSNAPTWPQTGAPAQAGTPSAQMPGFAAQQQASPFATGNPFVTGTPFATGNPLATFPASPQPRVFPASSGVMQAMPQAGLMKTDENGDRHHN